MKKLLFTLGVWLLIPAFSHAQATCSGLTSPDLIVYSPWSGDPATYQSWSSHIFLPSEIGPASTLTALKFVKNNIGSAVTFTNQYIYMRHTTASSYASNAYPGTAGFTLVWNGSYPNMTVGSSQTITITFSTNFNYNGTDNLEILFENRSNIAVNYGSKDPWIIRTNATAAARSKFRYSETSGTFPSASGFGSTRSFLPGIGLGSNCMPVTTFPVDWLEFSGEKKNNMVELRWSTASENNNDYFEIERSIDGKSFAPIGIEKGSGNSTAIAEYNFLDENPLVGNAYYRIKQTDYNSEFSYSPIISVKPSEAFDFSFHANIFDNEIELAIFSDVDSEEYYLFSLFDALGRPLIEKEIYVQSGSSVYLIPVSTDVSGGLYSVCLQNNNNLMQKKVFKK